MNMNMKNEKTMLALIVVAALAMVSVAGVALASDQSDAASDATQISIVGDQDINTAIGNYQFYASSSLGAPTTSAIVTITIPEGNGYTGTIEFGTLFTGDYVTLNSVSFSDAGGMIVTIDVDINAHSATISVAAIPDAEVSGTAIVGMGEFSFVNYEGDLTVGDTTFTFKNVTNNITMNVVNGIPAVSGTVEANTDKEPTGWDPSKDSYYASLTIDGTANISSLIIGSTVEDHSRYVEVIVTEGSNVTVPTDDTTYPINGSDTFTFTTTSEIVDDQTSATGYLLNKYGIQVGTAVIAYSSGTTTITVTTSEVISALEEYTMVIGMLKEGGDDDIPTYDIGTVSFTIDSDDHAVPTFSVSGNVTQLPTVSTSFGINSLAKGLTSTTDGYSLVYAANVTQGLVANSVAVSGTSTFANAIESGNVLFTLLKNDKTGAYAYYCGACSFSGSGDDRPVTFTTSVQASQFGNLTTGAVADDITPGSNEYTLEIKALAKVTVYGNLTAATSVENSTDGTLTNAGIINVTGLISCGSLIAGTINAAYYSVTTTSPANTTYYYTTIAKALTTSNAVTTVGDLTILEDMTIAGADITKNTTFTVSGTLNIGKTTDSAIVTVPTTTSGTVKTTLNITGGIINVVNGQLVLVGETSDRGISKITSDVFISTNGTYTDLAKAVEIVTDGEITLRQETKVVSDIDIVSAVTLNAKANQIIVDAGGKLVVDGVLKSTSTITVNKASGTKSAGILTFNTSDVKFTSLTMDGVFNIGESAEITLAGIQQTYTTTTEKIAPTINVDGTLNLTGAIGLSDDYTFVNVDGTLNMKSNASVAGNLYLTVSGTVNNAIDSTVSISKVTLTGTFNTTTSATVTEMNVTEGTVYADGADLTITTLVATGASSVSASKDNSITVSTKMTVGTAPTTFGNVTNNASVEIILADTGMAVVYGTYSDNISILNSSSEAADSTAYYLQANKNGSDTLYATAFIGVSTDIGDIFDGTNFAKIAIKGYNQNTTGGVWYNSIKAVADGVDVGTENYEMVYGYLTGVTCKVTLSYTPGITYVLNGVTYVNGAVADNLVYGVNYTLKIVVNDGYTGTPDVSVVGCTYSDNVFTVTDYDSDSNSVSVTGIEEKDVPVEKNYNDLVTILLVIITIVIIIMAVIIALKLLRS